ncbi:hypothetical protein D1007_59920 [Hordeum vulgare]|nr:hypothetical protein D1007_59920 [Hordeum vulgare]
MEKGGDGGLGRAHRHVEEVYQDGYIARKVKGVRRLITAWRWADKLQYAIDKELMWAPNEMASSFARKRQIGHQLEDATAMFLYCV